MTALWALTIASWFAIGVLALAVAGLLGQVRTLQAQVQAGGLLGKTVAGTLPEMPDAQVLLVDAHCQACAGLVKHPLIAEISVLAPGPASHWPPHTVIDKEAFDRLDPPFVPALARTDQHGAITELVPVGDPDDFTQALLDRRGRARETRG